METELKTRDGKAARTLASLWICWVAVMIVFAAFAPARFTVRRPDFALLWTPAETAPSSQSDKPYLLNPFLNAHVSWDSEYYISIATAGYDDPEMRAIPETFSWSRPEVSLKKIRPDWISMNYAFFPFYPLLMRVVSVPFGLFGMNAVAAATLAGVLISLLGTLGGMLALYDIAKSFLDPDGRFRAAFYLLIFPSSMFLAAVYTEGLFVGLSFGAVALSRRGRWIPAAILAFCATLTRAAGGFLLIPFAFSLWKQFGGTGMLKSMSLRKIATALLAAAPFWAYLTFNLTLGRNFHIIESRFYSRGLFLVGGTLNGWGAAFDWIRSGHPESAAYYSVELAAIAVAVVASIRLLRYDLPLALYGTAIFLFSLTSGAAQGMHRYVLAMPAIFLIPARAGKNPVVDRAWTLVSTLVMGVFWIMFATDFWAG